MVINYFKPDPYDCALTLYNYWTQNVYFELN
jgi:hypothetical protein